MVPISKLEPQVKLYSEGMNYQDMKKHEVIHVALQEVSGMGKSLQYFMQDLKHYVVQQQVFQSSGFLGY